MQMKDRLSRVGSAVGQHPISRFDDPLLSRNPSRREEEIDRQLPVGRCQIVEGRDVAARDDEDVRRRVRVNVSEGNHGVGFGDELRAKLAAHDAAEDAVPFGLLGHCHLSSCPRATIVRAGSRCTRLVVSMPELPEVETVRTSLAPAIAGRTIVGLRVGAFDGVVGNLDPGELAARLSDHRIAALRRRGKYLVIDLDDGTALLVHLRMTGSLVHVGAGAAPERFEHLAIVLDDGTELRFSDQRKFGRVLHVTAADVAALDARLGPEPLSPAFTADRLANSLARRTGRLKSVLLDQSLVAGLGNIYVDEALFRARLHPLRDANTLGPDEIRRLHHAIRAVLREGLTNRGTSFSSFRDGYGASGSNQNNLRVYGRGVSGAPCPRCGSPIVRLTVGGRGSHVCPRCQVLPDPSPTP